MGFLNVVREIVRDTELDPELVLMYRRDVRVGMRFRLNREGAIHKFDFSQRIG